MYCVKRVKRIPAYESDGSSLATALPLKKVGSIRITNFSKESEEESTVVWKNTELKYGMHALQEILN